MIRASVLFVFALVLPACGSQGAVPSAADSGTSAVTLAAADATWCNDHPPQVDRANRVVNGFPENLEVFSEEFVAAYSDLVSPTVGTLNLPAAVGLLRLRYPVEYATACEAAIEQCRLAPENPGFCGWPETDG
jgi:hypothetical protein